MKEPTFLGRPFGLLGVVVIMGVVIFFVGEQWRKKQDSGIVHRPTESTPSLDMIHEEGAVFHPNTSAVPLDHQAETDVNVRDLQTAYTLRHYPGAPPRIPHPIDPVLDRTANCNTCHEKGGFVPTYNAYAPVTPHPEYLNCNQCHVPQNATDLFKETEFAAVAPPPLHRPALPGGPPPIPHSLQLRENGLACHAGPAAPLAIRTTHPERVNCRQCHVPSDEGKAFDRTQLFLSFQKENP